MFNVYLAGPINGCNDAEAFNWRTDIKNKLKGTVRWVDPLDRDFRGKEQMNYVDIVENDLEAIRKCDMVLANLWKKDHPYYGTSMELMYAWMLHIPIIVVQRFGTDVKGEKLLNELGGKNLDFHPWVQYTASAVTRSLPEAVELISLYSEV